MLFRSLLSLLILVSAVSALRDGIYLIRMFEDNVLTANHEVGAPVVLRPHTYHLTSQLWRIESYGDLGYVIRHLGSSPDEPEHFLAPRYPKALGAHDEVVLSRYRFFWDLDISEEDRTFVSAQAGLMRTSPLVLSASPLKIFPQPTDIQELCPRDCVQSWEFQFLYNPRSSEVRRWRS